LNPVTFAYQAVPAAQNPGAVAAPAPSSAPAAGGEGAMGLPLMLLMFLPLVLVMIWQSRSQAKKQEQVLSALKKGDRVVTQSGLIGRLAELDGRYAKVEIAPGVKVTLLRTSLTGRDAEDAVKKDDGKKTDDAPKKDEASKKIEES
jgi:preprotein translocase subunit YajC